MSPPAAAAPDTRLARASALSSRIAWIDVLRVVLGALFISVFFDNLEKSLYTPGPYAGLIDDYAERNHAPGFWSDGFMGFVSDNASVFAPAQAGFELALGVLLVLGIATGAVALVAAGHLTALWISELGIFWVWEVLSLIVVAAVVGLAALPALADRARPPGRRLLGTPTYRGLSLPARLGLAAVGGAGLALVSLAAHTGGDAHYKTVAWESGLVFGALLVGLALLDRARR